MLSDGLSCDGASGTSSPREQPGQHGWESPSESSRNIEFLGPGGERIGGRRWGEYTTSPGNLVRGNS